MNGLGGWVLVFVSLSLSLSLSLSPFDHLRLYETFLLFISVFFFSSFLLLENTYYTFDTSLPCIVLLYRPRLVCLV